MINSSTKIRVSFIEPGSVLKSRGSYTSAKIKVTGNFTDNEHIEVLEESKTIRNANHVSSECVKILESSFVMYWITAKAWQPDFKNPSNASERIKLSIYQKFKTLSKEELLIAAVKMMLADIDIDYNSATIDIL